MLLYFDESQSAVLTGVDFLDPEQGVAGLPNVQKSSQNAQPGRSELAYRKNAICPTEAAPVDSFAVSPGRFVDIF